MYDPLTTSQESAFSQQQANGFPLGKASVPGPLLVSADLRELRWRLSSWEGQVALDTQSPHHIDSILPAYVIGPFTFLIFAPARSMKKCCDFWQLLQHACQYSNCLHILQLLCTIAAVVGAVQSDDDRRTLGTCQASTWVIAAAGEAVGPHRRAMLVALRLRWVWP